MFKVAPMFIITALSYYHFLDSIKNLNAGAVAVIIFTMAGTLFGIMISKSLANMNQFRINIFLIATPAICILTMGCFYKLTSMPVLAGWSGILTTLLVYTCLILSSLLIGIILMGSVLLLHKLNYQ